MKQCFITIIIAVGFSLWLQPLASPVRAQSDLNGAWEMKMAWSHNDNGDWTIEQVQPGMYLFHDGYYSIMYISGEELRPLLGEKPREEWTLEDWQAVGLPFIANAGRYSIQDSTIVYKPMVALGPDYMESGSATSTFRVKEDTLYTSASGEGWDWTIKFQRLH